MAREKWAGGGERRRKVGTSRALLKTRRALVELVLFSLLLELLVYRVEAQRV